MQNSYKNQVYNVKININNKIDELVVKGESSVSELRQTILDKYLLCPFNYSIYFKNKKLSMNDFHPVSNLFGNDTNPFLFIINNNILSPEYCTENNVSGIITNTNEKKLNEMLGKFFEYKSLPFNANVKNLIKGKFKIKFNKPILANEFMQFYNINNMRKFQYNNNNQPKEIKLPPIKKNNLRSVSSDYILERNRKENFINKVIKSNSKDSFITEKSIRSGINIYHNSIHNKKKKYDHDEYQGVSVLPYMSPDEKYYREKLLDKIKYYHKKNPFLLTHLSFRMSRKLWHSGDCEGVAVT